MSFTIKKQNGDVFTVIVLGKTTTIHTVTVTDATLDELTSGHVSKVSLLEFSFEFLLNKESNTSILSSFDVNVIPRYFPDYKEEVRTWSNENENKNL